MRDVADFGRLPENLGDRINFPVASGAPVPVY